MYVQLTAMRDSGQFTWRSFRREEHPEHFKLRFARVPFARGHHHARAVLDYQLPGLSPDRLSGYGVLPYIAAPRFANIRTVALASGMALALQSARQAIHLLG